MGWALEREEEGKEEAVEEARKEKGNKRVLKWPNIPSSGTVKKLEHNTQLSSSKRQFEIQWKQGSLSSSSFIF